MMKSNPEMRGRLSPHCLMITAAVLLGASAAIQGCTTGNERLNLGGPSPDAQIEIASFAGNQVPAPVSPAAPSLSGLSRSHWAPIEVTTVPDGLASKPTYASTIGFSVNSVRSRGDFPTAVSALDVSRQGAWSKSSEGLRAPVRSAWDLSRALAWDLWTSPPTREIFTSPAQYERVPVQINARPTAAAPQQADEATPGSR
jgi:hypothetical protein